MEELNSATDHHSQSKCQLIQTSHIKRINLFLFLPYHNKHLIISYVVRFTHGEKNPRKIRTKFTSDQPEKRKTVKYIVRPTRNTNNGASQSFTVEGNKHAAFCGNKMEEEIPRFALLEGTIDDFIDEQENKNTRAKTET